VLTRDPAGAAGRVTFTPGAEADETVPALFDFAQALAGRRPLHWSGGGGAWALAWS
jgi:hypothetical protein